MRDKRDFEFVTLPLKEETIEIKSRSFFYDSLLRFKKNKASIVALILLFLLFLLSLVAPTFQGDIQKDASELRFLPPRIFSNINSFGFLDGTNKVQNVIVEEKDGEVILPDTYQKEYVVGEIQTKVENKNSIPSIYGWDGELVISSTKESLIFFSAPQSWSRIQVYDLQIEFAKGTLCPFTLKFIDGDNGKTLIPYVMSEDIINIKFSPPSENGFLQLQFHQKNIEVSILSFIIKDLDQNVMPVSFRDGNEGTLKAQENKMWDSNGSISLRNGKIRKADFRYNVYQDVFGEKIEVIDDLLMDQYIKKGYCKYSYLQGVSSFELVDDRCPIREVYEQKDISVAGVSSIQIKCKISSYRKMGYKTMPKFIFGTNHNGVNYFKLIFVGLRNSILLGLLVTIICIVIGIIYGAVSGYYGGNIDLFLERLQEIISGVPTFVIVSLFVLHLGSSFGVFLLALIFNGWTSTGLRMRAQFYRYKKQEYVLASRSLGAKDSRLILHHILPNAIGPIITSGVLILPNVIFLEATLSYLGLGLQGSTSFGYSLVKAQEYISNAPYLIIGGSLILVILMISFNLLGNGLRDALNPTLE